MRYITLKDLTEIPQSITINIDKTTNLGNNIRGISIDSRSIKSREVFWAIQGDRFDGHDFIRTAVTNGASGIVANKSSESKTKGIDLPVILVDDSLEAMRIFASKYRSKFSIPVLGITGTNGKTTTKEMIAWILQKKYSVLKTPGNFNNLIGTPLSLFQLNSDHQVAVIEVGTNQPGEIKKLAKIVKPTAALITNIGRGHLQNFSSIDGLAKEKLCLFKSISRRGIIFLNQDDERLPKFPFRRNTLWSYSLNGIKKARVTGKFIELNAEGMGVWELNNKVTITMKVPGIHHVKNALAASTVALYFGMQESEIKDALENYTSYDKRMQIIKSGEAVIINDTYNANPESFDAALKTLTHMADYNKGRKIVVIGDMLELGLASEAMHRDLFFNFLHYNVEGIFAFGNECRIAAEELKLKGFEQVFWFDNHEDLAKQLKTFMKSGDYVLLKGSRGMQMEKVLRYL